MILNLIKLGIKILLKTYCEKIKIKRLEIAIKNNIFKGEVEKIIIEAEKIIYRGIHLNYAKINGFDLNIDFNKEIRFLKVKDFYANTILHVNKENLINIINNKDLSEMNNKIREFTVQNNNIEEIFFRDQLILFNFLKDKNKYQKCFNLKINNNNLRLKDINSKKELLIKFDTNIIFNNLRFYKNFVKVELTSKVKIDD